MPHTTDKELKAPTGPFGFLLITVDPPAVGKQRDSALSLVRYRLERGRWPLYNFTRNRRIIEVGSRLAFYVAGKMEQGGRVVATATVAAKTSARGPVDPPHYFSDAPDQVITLKDVTFLEPAPVLRDVVMDLSFKPSNPQCWGVVLKGGCRALTEPDWKKVLRLG